MSADTSMPFSERARRAIRRRRRSHRAVSGLRSQWSAYPKRWRKHGFLNLGTETLGEEWGGPEFASAIVDDLVAEYLKPDADVLELGCGGGKFSQRIAPKVHSLKCCDISQQMIEQATNELDKRGVGENVSFQVLNGTDFSGVDPDSVDFVFSYDVQLHLQPQNVFSYLLDARRVLRKDGVFMLHQINLNSDGGKTHFLAQFYEETWDYAFDSPSRLGHIYFMSRDQMTALAELAGLDVVKIVDDFPGAESPLYEVTSGRDLFGFFRAKPSRLDALAASSARILKLDGDAEIWVVLEDGTRAAIRTPKQFDRAGFDWDSIETVTNEQLAAIPVAKRELELWE